MPQYDASGRALNNRYKKIAASQTTAQVSVSGDSVAGRDYCDSLIITAASTAAPGVVTLFDGTTSLVAHQFVAGTMTDLTWKVEVNAVADSTKGFNITTGTSVSVIFVGRY
jgi:hypothetical protein